ncbi:uncharacterized protein LOC111351258 isoform X5 [Spodoptera litura]|uniref:Uncharacterized protein LOC111351258 isoform X5 n=2 Tax=Spodoptera litura TaxID=69820 RepID=A0A9J7DXU7_SPOLT|nr:uncharacterized protein LOC111351258 isoform X5 [Spodoptera litura]
MNNSKVYKRCAVPLCYSTSNKTPKKIFVYVPTQIERRKEWFRLARIDKDIDRLLEATSVYYCEDHFDLPNDMENYMQYQIMGSVAKIKMKPDSLPTRFNCQLNKKCTSFLPRPSTAGSSEEIVVKTENAEEIFIKTEPIYPDETVPEVADVRFHDKGVQTKPDVEDRGVQGCPRRFRSKAVQYNSDVPPRITFLKLVRDETEKMMVRVYKYLRDELEILKLMTAEQVLVALEQVSGRAAQATGVSELDMQQTLDKYKDLLDKQPTKKTLDKTNKPKKKRKQGMHVRTFSFSNESTDDEQPPKVRGAETDSGSAGVSVQTVTEPSAMEVDCGGGNSIDETTARRETSVQEEVHDSNGESTDEALEEEPEIYIKDEPLTEDDDSANPLEIGVVAPSIAHTAHTPSDTYTTTTTDIQTYDPGEDVRIKTEYGEPEPSHDHTYHKNT